VAKQNKTSIRRDITRRVNFSFGLIVLFALAIIGKAAHTQATKGAELRSKAHESFTRNDTIRPNRGNIYTEDGRVLSATIPKFDLKMDLSVIDKDTFNNYLDTISRALSKIFADGETAMAIKMRMRNAYQKELKYWTLKKNVPYYQYQEIRTLPIFSKSKNKGGFLAEPVMKRVNPYGMLGYRTIGLWRANAPNIGLENAYNEELTGKEGYRLMHYVGGQYVPIAGSEIEAEHGRDIVSTIDIEVQEVTHHALHEVMEKYECLQGTAIVMEVATGKIRAIANLGRHKDGKYIEDFNYAMIPSEPGSVFKLITLYALLEDGYTTIDGTVDCMGGIARFGRQTVRDDHRGLGRITVKEAFAQSSNVAFASLANIHYKNKPMQFIKHLQKLRLHMPSGIDLAGERKTLIKTPDHKHWNKVTSLPWIAYGYESMITPLHTCMVYNAVANNGKMMKPYLVSAIMDDGKLVKSIEPTVLVEQIGKPSTIKQLQQATRAVVEKGTAKAAQSPYYTAAGKTGTAQVHDVIDGVTYRYSDGVRQGSFVGYFPADNPKYTIAVVIRSKPHGVYYGAQLGVPVFKAIADKLYATKIGGWKLDIDSLGKQPTLHAKKAPSAQLQYLLQRMGEEVEVSHPTALLSQLVGGKGVKKKVEPVDVKESIVPDVAGMGVKEALFLLENAGLKVLLRGAGEVVEQSLPAGTKFKKGQTISLTLN